MKNEFMAITDLEATCWDDKSNHGEFQRKNSEIIEIGAILVSLDEKSYLDVIKEFTVFIKPTKYPILSDFCKTLTSISQKNVDGGMSFSDAIQSFKKEMFLSPQTLFGSWGKYDFNFMKEQCDKQKIPVPFDTQKVVNLKSLVASINDWKKRGLGVSRTLKELDMDFKGTPHRGIDDSKNIRRILLRMKDKLKL